MAKVHEEVAVITVSKLIKNDDSGAGVIITEDIIAAPTSVAEELIGPGVVVEVNKA